MDDCLGRSKTQLGSSSSYPATASLGGGYFDSDCKSNPLMCTWNKVMMRYCDGASFSGNNLTVAEYKGAKLHWRGMHIRENIAKQLFESHGMRNASDLMVSGCSAGGLATYLHTDQWCDKLKAANPSAKCAGLPDSGFFLDFQDPSVTCSPESPAAAPPAAAAAADAADAEVTSSAVARRMNTIDGDYHCGRFGGEQTRGGGGHPVMMMRRCM